MIDINSCYLIKIVLLGDPEVTANVFCKSRNLPNTDTQNYSTDLRYLPGHPVCIRQLKFVVKNAYITKVLKGQFSKAAAQTSHKMEKYDMIQY